MARPRSQTPSYRHHQSGQARVTIAGKDLYLGPFGSPDSYREYARLLAEFQTTGTVTPPSARPPLIVAELIAMYLRYARTYYVKGGRPTREISAIQSAVRPLLELYAHTAAVDFGPRGLQAVRAEMVDSGWTRKSVNSQVGRLRRAWQWAVEQEILPETVWRALQAVRGLRKGQGGVAEGRRVLPVAWDRVAAVEGAVSGQVWAMIRLQWLTAMRPGEVVILRPCDLDQDVARDVWEYRPSAHKLEHLDVERIVPLGPKAREILAPWLLRPPEAYCFCPAESERARHKARAARRKTPLSCGNRPGTNRKVDPERTPGDRYTTTTYRVAVTRACDIVWPPPGTLARRTGETCLHHAARIRLANLVPEDREELLAWRRSHRWHPNQLRHAAATRIASEFGLEKARPVLGHQVLQTTELYAEMDRAAAREIARKIG